MSIPDAAGAAGAPPPDDGRTPIERVQSPVRAIGFRDLVLFYVVTGVSLRWVATASGAGPSSITVWAGAWLVFYVPLALTVLELSSRYPDEGGLYIWTKRAFGNFAGFISAWTYWTSNLPYFAAILYFGASNALFALGPRAQTLASSRAYFIAFSLIGLALPTVLHIVGLRVGQTLNNLGALGIWLPVMIVVTLGVVSWHRFGSATHFTVASLRPGFDLKDVLFWSGIFYAFCGCESASFMGEEIRDPRRNIPRALILGGALVTLVYIVGTVFVLLALPSREVSDLQGLIQAISLTAPRLGFAFLVPLAAALISLSNLGSAGAYLAATARLPFVAGIDHYLPPVFGRLHPRFKTPHIAILTQSIAAAVVIVLSQAGTSVRGAYNVLLSMGIIANFIPFLFLFAALIRLQREPAGPDVIRIPGGRRVVAVVAVMGLASTVAAIVLSVVPSPDETNKTLAVMKILGLTGVLLMVGVAVYWRAKRKAARERA